MEWKINFKRKRAKWSNTREISIQNLFFRQRSFFFVQLEAVDHPLSPLQKKNRYKILSDYSRTIVFSCSLVCVFHFYLSATVQSFGIEEK